MNLSGHLVHPLYTGNGYSSFVSKKLPVFQCCFTVMIGTFSVNRIHGKPTRDLLVAKGRVSTKRTQSLSSLSSHIK